MGSTRIRTAALAVAALTLLPALASAAVPERVKIRNSRTGLVADVMWASKQPGQGVFLYRHTGSGSQAFDVIEVGGGFFQLRARHSRLCLSLDRRAPFFSNGTAVTQDTCDRGRKSTHWRRRYVGEPQTCDGDVCSISSLAVPTLVNRYTGKCLDARGTPPRVPRAQAVLQQWTCIRYVSDFNAANQLFQVGTHAHP